MTDITHNNVFTNNDMTPAAPAGPRPRRGAGFCRNATPITNSRRARRRPPTADPLARRSPTSRSAVVDEAASMVLAKYQELKDQIAEGEQMILSVTS